MLDNEFWTNFHNRVDSASVAELIVLKDQVNEQIRRMEDPDMIREMKRARRIIEGAQLTRSDLARAEKRESDRPAQKPAIGRVK